THPTGPRVTQARTTRRGTPSQKKKNTGLIVGLAIVAVLLINAGITVPVVLLNRDDDKEAVKQVTEEAMQAVGRRRFHQGRTVRGHCDPYARYTAVVPARSNLTSPARGSLSKRLVMITKRL